MKRSARLALAGVILGCLSAGSSYRAHAEEDTLDPPVVTDWIPAERRIGLRSLDISLKDHNGRARMLSELLDRPALITFFYTRCQNASKCSMTVSHLAFLQRQLVEAGIDGMVRLIAITYEPQFDTPERINLKTAVDNKQAARKPHG